MSRTIVAVLTGASSLISICPAFAEKENSNVISAESSMAKNGGTLDAIIVTARRREENLQDVPTSVSVLGADDIEELQLRDFSELEKVFAGLSLPSAGVAAVRGISFNQAASGNNATIGFFVNDAPVVSSDLFRTMFDIGQIELLRGPQGTLRGKASPSGALTLTTRRPDLQSVGGYVNTTGTHRGGTNFNGAFGVPLIEGILAVRLAGLIDESDEDYVKSLNSETDPLNRTKALRGTVLFQPYNDLEIVFTAQRYKDRGRSYIQLESSSVSASSFIVPDDRRALMDSPQLVETENTNYNLQVEWSFAGQRLNYVGQRTLEYVETQERSDIGELFGPTSPIAYQGFGTFTDRDVKTWAHEVRLASEDRLFNVLNYTLGIFHNTLDAPSTFYTPQAINVPAGTTLVTKALRLKEDEETSIFGNLTLHLGERTELSVGARHIDFKINADLCSWNGFFSSEPLIGPVEFTTACALVSSFKQREKFDTWIWSTSLEHEFTDALMAYALIGTSWRPGVFPGGLDASSLSERQRSFLALPPEESTSYEVGFKSSLLEGRMTLNFAAFYQDFEDYPFRPSTPLTFVAPTSSGALRAQTRAIFVAAVPVEVWGGELEWRFMPNENWNLGANVAFAKSKIKNGLVPCNDYLAPFGKADPAGSTYTAAQIVVATNGENIGACRLTASASTSPEWSANANAEYRLALTHSTEGFVRGLVSFFGHNDNDVLNSIDDVNDYSLVSLYMGIRDHSGNWELSLYGKNLTDTLRVLRRDSSDLAGPPSLTPLGTQPYRRIEVNLPREFGLDFRYSFGSR